MYEPHHQPDHTLPKNTLTDFDYQLMLDANAFAKYNPNMVEYKDPEYSVLMHANASQLCPSITEKHHHHDEYAFGSDSTTNGNESLHYRNMDQQFVNTSSLNLSLSNSDAPHFSSANLAYSAPAPPSISKQQYLQCTANPYIVYQQNFENASDPSLYPSLEEYVSTSNPSLYNNGDDYNNLNAARHDQHLEQFYGGAVDEQQQFMLLQQQKTWAQNQQQQQALGYSHNQHGHASPSSFYSTAYTTENDSRSQIYVRKACVSCKQSHVACDVQRPCSRCVRLNKTESCVDAQRKKRGRPCGSGKKKKDEDKEFRRQQQQYF